jgi:hypothetical protein
MNASTGPSTNTRDYEILVGLMIRYAIETMGKKGRVRPFGGIIERDGNEGILDDGNPGLIFPPFQPKGHPEPPEDLLVLFMVSGIINYAKDLGHPILAAVCQYREDFGFINSNDDCVLIQLEHSDGGSWDIRWRIRKGQQYLDPKNDITAGTDADRLIFDKSGKLKNPPIPITEKHLTISKCENLRPTQDVGSWKDSLRIVTGKYVICVPIYSLYERKPIHEHTARVMAKESERVWKKLEKKKKGFETMRPGNVYQINTNLDPDTKAVGSSNKNKE